MTILLLEGPDGSGKTTLARHLEAEGFHNRHFGLVQKPFEKYLYHLLSLEPNQNHVIDRLHISERIYGTICRGHDRLAGCHRMLDRVCLSLGVILVACLPRYKVAKENWASRPEVELEKDEERYKAIYDAYTRLYKHTALPIIHYDYGSDDLGLRGLFDRLKRAAYPANPGPGVGHWKRGVTLIVGERPGVGNGPGLPFVWHQASSRWLAQQLDDVGANEADLYWVNAYGADGEETRPEFVEHLAPTQIIALGRVAERWCHRNCVGSFETVPHPQFWKRFHYHERYPLLDLLEHNR